MAYGQPFYTYPNAGYTPYQAPTYNAYAPQMPIMPLNAQNQPLNGFQGQGQANAQPTAQMATQQNIQPQQANPAPTPQGFPIRELRFVTSEEAKAYIVMPNSNALLLDTANGMAYLKTADNLGQSVTECFKYSKVNADGTPIQPTEKTPSKYVTVDDFNSFVEKLNSQFVTFGEQIEALQKKMVSKPIKTDKVKEVDNAE